MLILKRIKDYFVVNKPYDIFVDVFLLFFSFGWWFFLGYLVTKGSERAFHTPEVSFAAIILIGVTLIIFSFFWNIFFQYWESTSYEEMARNRGDTYKPRPKPKPKPKPRQKGYWEE